MTTFATLTLPDLTTVLENLARPEASGTGGRFSHREQLTFLPRRSFADGEGVKGRLSPILPPAGSSKGQEANCPTRPSEIHIVRTVHRGDPIGPRHTVLMGSGYYAVNKYLLASLQNGMTPDELDLEPVEEGGEV